MLYHGISHDFKGFHVPLSISGIARDLQSFQWISLRGAQQCSQYLISDYHFHGWIYASISTFVLGGDILTQIWPGTLIL